MAGLTGSKTTIGADGKTVTTIAETERAAQAIAARQEQALVDEEGGPWRRFNNWLDRVLQRGEETNGIISRRTVGFLAWCAFLGAAIMQWNGWWRLIPVEGLNLVLAAFGVLIVAAMKLAAARVGQADRDGDKTLAGVLRGVMWGGLVLGVIVATSLQSSIAVDVQTGRTDVQAEIARLNQERSLLLPKVANDPGVTEAEQQLVIDAYLRTPMVNSKGAQLYRTFQDLLKDTECKGSSYYVGIYCPTYFELLAAKEDAKTYAANKARFDAIPGEIHKLQEERPAQSSTFAMVQKFTGDTENVGAVIAPALITLLVELAMLFLTWMSKRPPPKPAPAGTA